MYDYTTTYNAPELHRNVYFRDKLWELYFHFSEKKVHVILQVVTMMYINLTLSVCTVSVKLHYNEYSIFIVHKDRCLKLHFSDRYSWRLG